MGRKQKSLCKEVPKWRAIFPYTLWCVETYTTTQKKQKNLFIFNWNTEKQLTVAAPSSFKLVERISVYPINIFSLYFLFFFQPLGTKKKCLTISKVRKETWRRPCPLSVWCGFYTLGEKGSHKNRHLSADPNIFFFLTCVATAWKMCVFFFFNFPCIVHFNILFCRLFTSIAGARPFWGN